MAGIESERDRLTQRESESYVTPGGSLLRDHEEDTVEGAGWYWSSLPSSVSCPNVLSFLCILPIFLLLYIWLGIVPSFCVIERERLHSRSQCLGLTNVFTNRYDSPFVLFIQQLARAGQTAFVWKNSEVEHLLQWLLITAVTIVTVIKRNTKDGHFHYTRKSSQLTWHFMNLNQKKKKKKSKSK